jgi:hypothetical protein
LYLQLVLVSLDRPDQPDQQDQQDQLVRPVNQFQPQT